MCCIEDNFSVLYDSTEMDKEGEKSVQKHVCANPKDPMICPNTALGIWLALNQASFEKSQKLFRKEGTVRKSSSNKCSENLVELFKHYQNQVLLCVAFASSHGIRKGSETSVSSGTTLPSPIASIAARGDWSISKVLDIYWNFAEPGDHYLGRCLTGSDVNSADFGILPPHFKMDNLLDDPDVKEAMNPMHGTTIDAHKDAVKIQQVH